MNKMNRNCFKYEMRKGKGRICTTRNLNWFERLMYRFKGYKVIKLS